MTEAPTTTATANGELAATLTRAVRQGVKSAWEQHKTRPWSKIIFGSLLGLAGFGFAEKVIEDNSSINIPGLWTKGYPLPSLLTPASASEPQASQFTRSFVIQSAGKTKDGALYFFNDKTDWKDPTTFTVVVEAVKLPTVTDPRSLKGKTLTATGRADTYNGKPQLRVEDGSKFIAK